MLLERYGCGHEIRRFAGAEVAGRAEAAIIQVVAGCGAIFQEAGGGVGEGGGRAGPA
ncbi:MAG: hypothetical protein HYV63_20075 [Candidatus Schekmanbacteria bacterium]|nr:hypothetical protein [Candidatus Schekmanbacteria bacterium]